jgi:hypothetical protein
MKEMNSETHSCMHSFASLAIFAFSGKAVFMMRATGAKFPMSVSASGDVGGLYCCMVNKQNKTKAIGYQERDRCG